MSLFLKMGKDYKAFLRALKKAPDAMADAIETGVADALGHGPNPGAAGAVQERFTDFMTARSGNLRRAIHSYEDAASRFFGFVGVGSREGVESYAWMLGDEVRTIRPKSGKFLAIPAGANKTAAGVGGNIAGSPRDVADGFFIRKGARLLFGDAPSEGTFRLLFVLVPEVTVFGSGLLPDVMIEQEDTMLKVIKNHVVRALNKLGLTRGR